MEEPLLDFEKVCRVCLKDGKMMSVFKVNISKKIMACTSVQVWQNDGLPDQICNKCSAKLHISFQFKKLCERSDANLRQQLTKSKTVALEPPLPPQPEQQHPQPIVENQTATACVFLECNPVIEMYQEDKFDPFTHLPQQPQQPPLTAVDYNVQPQMGVYGGESLGQVQVYHNGGGYAMHLGQMQMPQQHLHQLLEQQQPQQQIVQSVGVMPPQQQGVSVQQEVVVVGDASKGKDLKKEDKGQENVKKCNVCSKVFSTARQMSRHLKTHIKDKPYKCNVCSKAFSHSGNFKIHLRMHTDERPYKCTVCDKGCRQAQDLEKHMRTHTGERPHQCNICERAFSTSSNLIAHIRTHTGERPYVCCVCQKAFCQSNELTKHMRTHTGEKSHICDICHKGFNGSSTLIVHRRSHTGERPYVCKICNKAFIQSGCLAQHMKRHSDNNTIPEKRFGCTSCDKKFSRLRDLQRHTKTAHPSTSYPCGTCDTTFTNLEEYNKHGCSGNTLQ